MSRLPLAQTLPWLIPLAACAILFWPGLFCWFYQDDFSHLQTEIHWRTLLEPQAQGVIRPLSTTLFFGVFRRLFDLNALPYRVFVFLVQSANLLLLVAISRRLNTTWAAAVWAVNIALLAPLTWTAAFNQVACAFFFLLGFLLFLRHAETGRWSWYFAQCVALVAGFGALESMAAYPAVLLVYCLLAARAHVWKALALWPPALLYAAVHLWIIPRDPAGPYVPRLDLRIFGAIWDYWTRVLGRPGAWPVVLLLTAGLLAAFLRARRQDRRIALFGLAWFLATLAPVLPLGDHRLDYYLTIPAIGFSLAAAALIPAVPRLAAAVWLGAYLAFSTLLVHSGVRSQCDRSQAGLRLVQALRQIRSGHPPDTILLTGVGDPLFYGLIYHGGLRVAGLDNVYLAPTNDGIRMQPGLFLPDNYKLPQRQTLALLHANRAIVYEVAGPRLQNITNRYKTLAGALLQPLPPRRVDIGDPRLADQLGPGWYEVQGRHRWMGRRAEVRLAAPRSAQAHLRMDAFYDPRAGPVILTLSVNGMVFARVEIRSPRGAAQVFPLPASLAGLDEITIVLQADHTFRAPFDPRDLSLAFGALEILE